MLTLHIKISIDTFKFHVMLVLIMAALTTIFALLDRYIEKGKSAWDNNYSEINQEKYPKMCKLKKLRHSIFYYTQPQRKKQAIKTKIKSYNVEATLLDVMMTTQQLYKANNPLWARGVSLDEIEIVEMLSGHDAAKNEILKFLQDK